MQFITSAAALLLAASSAMASPAMRRQTELDTKVRVILRDDMGGLEIREFDPVDGNLSTGVDSDIQFTTVEIDIGHDVEPTLRCGVSLDDGVLIVANRGANRDSKFMGGIG